MDEQPTQPTAPSYSPTTSGSSQSIPTLSTLPTEERTNTGLSTSPSGRVTFIFPSILKPTARSAKPTSAPSFAELSSADLVPASSSTASSKESRRPALSRPPEATPLRLITDDALTSLLDPPAHRIRNGREVADTVEEWVESSKQTILLGSQQGEGSDKTQCP